MEYKWFILKPAIIYYMTHFSHVGSGKNIAIIRNMLKLLQAHCWWATNCAGQLWLDPAESLDQNVAKNGNNCLQI